MERVRIGEGGVNSNYLEVSFGWGNSIITPAQRGAYSELFENLTSICRMVIVPILNWATKSQGYLV